jgi:hypothetical protein
VNHLVMAQEIRNDERLVASARRALEADWGAFLLGSAAPDVQTVSHQPRRATHFYNIPPSDETVAHRALLAAHPALAHSDTLAADHAAFVAGYLAHLVADEAWWRQVFDPIFGIDADWGRWRERIFLHNVLRTHLDRVDQTRLNGSVVMALAEAEPRQWLPFVEDQVLVAWRDLLVAQLQPGEYVRTAEVFAERMHVTPERVKEALESPDQMARIFQHVSEVELVHYRSGVLRRSIDLINGYLG